MNPFLRLTSFRAIAALALGAVTFSSALLHGQDAAPAAQPAPAWKLQDLDGHEVSSDQFKGKVVIVDFWATWCGPCISEIPGYIALQKKYGADGLVIVGIAYRDFKGPANVKKFAQEKGMNYTIVIGDETVADAFGGIDGIPSTFLINRDGRIIHHKLGAMPHEEYEKIVKQALN
jgi:thiol-disulfide isomerase/thioredoxin